MNCCCARKATVREQAQVPQAVRRGIPNGLKTSRSMHGANGANGAHGANGANGEPPLSTRNLGGVGIVFQTVDHNKGLVVASLAVDSPAEQCGKVRPGDVLVSIDKIDVRGLPAEDLAQHILGVPGSGVRLGFLRAGTEVFFVELVRGWTMKRSHESRWSNPLPPNHSLVTGPIGPD